MRLTVELEVAPEDIALRNAYRRREEETLLGELRQRSAGLLAARRIVSWPSFGFRFSPEATDRVLVENRLDRLFLAVEVDARSESEEFLDGLRAKGLKLGADAPIDSFDSWCPTADAPPLFHRRPAADALLGAGALRRAALRGEGVNLVVVDQGINTASLRARFPDLPGAGGAPNFIGGWDVQEEPGGPWREAGHGLVDGHGTMVALNALSLAPAVRIFDLPLLPDRINDVRRYTTLMAAALAYVWTEIVLELSARYPGPWVFCHAWGIYDRRFEVPHGGYTAQPKHPLNGLVALLDVGPAFDQVFAAGNCGQFCPNGRCGHMDRGPGNSILGANSSPHVLTVGAVRADGAWIGYSSQGPGQRKFFELPVGTPRERQKPDLCAPSHFVEPGDGRFLSSGTSAACGLAAGAVAALRSDLSPTKGMSPQELRRHLRDTAQSPLDMLGPHDLRYGSGILDLEAAVSEAAAAVPAPGA